jgi:hypothetical protein
MWSFQGWFIDQGYAFSLPTLVLSSYIVNNYRAKPMLMLSQYAICHQCSENVYPVLLPSKFLLLRSVDAHRNHLNGLTLCLTRSQFYPFKERVFDHKVYRLADGGNRMAYLG